LRGVAVLNVLALAAFAGAQASDHSTVLGAALGVATYEGFALAERGWLDRFESFYDVGFHFSGDFYRNAGRLTHLVTFDFAATRVLLARNGLSNRYPSSN